MRKSVFTLCLVLGAVCHGQPAGRAFDLPTLDAITYIRDYSPGHLDSEDFLGAIRANTPHLLVLGKDAPLHHNWGFVAGTGGENQAFGKGEHIQRLTPDEGLAKMAEVKTMVANLHAIGVRWVMPYICTMTIGGHHEKRTGFWEFYDHWDEYAAFQLGPRPAADPMDWMQRTAEGEVRTYYQWDAPYYAPNYRWAACVNSPAWRQHLGNVVRLAAQAGYDGVYMDNNSSTGCYCEHCQEAFRQYLAKRVTAKDLKADLGFGSLEQARMSTEPRTYLWRLTAEFKTDSKVGFLRELKGMGTKALGKEFHIFANTGAWMHGGHELQRVSTVASFIQSEENGHSTGAHPGLAREKITGNLFYQTVNRRVVEHKFTRSLCSGLRVTMTTRNSRAGSPWARRAVDQNPQTAALAMAESATYAGGGAFKMQLKWDANREIKRWREFFDQHQDLYEGYSAWAPVGVIAFAEQHYFTNSRQTRAALHKCALELAENHVLFDMIHEAQLSLDRLRRHSAVVVPSGVSYLSNAQLDVFRRYAQAGKLVVLGDDFATFDEKCRERHAAQASIRQPVSLRSAPSTEQLLNALGPHAGVLRDASDRAPAGVGVNAFVKPSRARPTDLVLHLVNYNVPLGRGSTSPPMPVQNLTARVPLPADWRVTAVDAASHIEGEDLRVEWRQERDEVVINVPKLHLYQAVRIQGRKEGAQ